jgi:hypothetical protein
MKLKLMVVAMRLVALGLALKLGGHPDFFDG